MSSHLHRRLVPVVIVGVFSLPTSLCAADATPPNNDAKSALDRALENSDSSSAAGVQSLTKPTSTTLVQIGGGGGTPTLKLIDISLDVLTAGGASTATDLQLENLQGGEHDPKRRGFTFQQAELSFFGAVDPYFNLQAHIVYREDAVELEEAYGTTTQLPAQLQLKVGYYLTEFGRANPQHPHQWPWLDQPVVNSRLFGPDGNRAVGARISWLAPLPWFSEILIGMQNPNDPTERSFEGGEAPENGPALTIGGRPVVTQTTRSLADFLYAVRWVNNWELPADTMLQLGFSGAFGPNNTGLTGRTTLLGADLLVKWHESVHGLPNIVWQSEIIARKYQADEGVDPTLATIIPSDVLHDWGLSSQVLVGFYPRWAAGFRGEYASGSGDSYEVGSGSVSRQSDPWRDDRWRLSPLVTFNPSEFSKIRLQYNYEHAEHLPTHYAQSVWIGLELMIGAHPAHNY